MSEINEMCNLCHKKSKYLSITLYYDKYEKRLANCDLCAYIAYEEILKNVNCYICKKQQVNRLTDYIVYNQTLNQHNVVLLCDDDKCKETCIINNGDIEYKKVLMYMKKTSSLNNKLKKRKNYQIKKPYSQPNFEFTK